MFNPPNGLKPETSEMYQRALQAWEKIQEEGLPYDARSLYLLGFMDGAIYGLNAGKNIAIRAIDSVAAEREAK